MTYLTGLTLGISAGRQIHRLLRFKSYSLLHAVPGRRRYRYDAFIQNPALAQVWERHLLQIPGVRQVHITPLTGSLVIEYSCPAEHLELCLEYLDQLRKLPAADSDYGKVGSDIRQLFDKINRDIFQNTNRVLDLRTLLALGMTIWGSTKMWTLGHRPTGPQLIWWAYSLLKGRNG